MPDITDYLEAAKLKLDAENIPFTVSIEDAIWAQYLESESQTADTEATPTARLLELLRQFDAENADLTQLIQIIGAQLSPKEKAKLQCLAQAQSHFSEHYTLAPELQQLLKRLDIAAAALALSDPTFFTPGAHPYHQLLDSVQSCAVGWQPDLGRAGKPLIKQLETAVTNIQAWLRSDNDQLAPICQRAIEVLSKDQARTQRMAQRLVETEQGRIKASGAKQQAAAMINKALSSYELPQCIGEFLKSAWYDSAQLVWLKHGEQSEQWQQMTATTATLCQSLQDGNTSSAEDRQALFELANTLPKDIKIWLLSLQHDDQAINDHIRMIEAQHVQVLKQQALSLEAIDLIALDADSEAHSDDSIPEVLGEQDEGQWYLITQDEEQTRAQLTLKLDQDRQLLFTNHAGVKSLQLDYASFAEALAAGEVEPLDSGAAFSLSLCAAAGLNTASDYDQYLLELERAEQARLEAERKQAEEAERQRRLEEERKQREAEEKAEREEKQRREAEEQARREEQRQREAKEKAERDQQQRREAEEKALREEQEGQQALAEAQAQRTEQGSDSTSNAAESAREPNAEETDNEKLVSSYFAPANEDNAPLAQLQTSELLAEGVVTMDTVIEDMLDTSGPKTESLVDTGDTDAPATDVDFQLNLPMGAWLGFHDGDTPMMAKLAVHDRESDKYIFVNRDGIKLRELSRTEMMKLITADMVDVIETRSTFKDAVRQLKKIQDSDT